ADPVADDLATLGLDIAVGEAGYERGGFHRFGGRTAADAANRVCDVRVH
ncbi:formate dehydrogenase accessory protein FdhE, partial [Neisseria dentiae]